MKKVLFTATVDSHILRFHLPYLKWFHNNGYEVHVATNGNEEIPYCDKKHKISFERNPIKINNIKAIIQLKKIIDTEKFNIIHCHTPMGGVVTRISAMKSRKKENTRVIYTAHGFHFYKGASKLNWLIYYPIEKFFSKYTDCLITINKEDYELAKNRFKKCKDIRLVHGVGLDISKFSYQLTNEEKESKRKELGILKDDIVFSYVAELNKNKNQDLLINMMNNLKNKISNIKLLLIGDGNLREYYKKEIIDKNLTDKILLLGVRSDINELLSITDIYLASSLREGLPINILEAMYKEVPIIAMDNRGHRELIENEKNGFIIGNEIDLKNRIIELIENENLKNSFTKNSKEKSIVYLIENVMEEMKEIYEYEETK